MTQIRTKALIPFMLLALTLLIGGCATRNLETEHIVTRDRGEQYTGVSREEIRQTISSAMPSIKSCYERELRKNAKLSGKLVMKWSFDESGKVTDVGVVKSMESPEVETCVSSVIKGLKFPKPGNSRIAEVTFPFIFYANQ